jgi:hypothetical protein
MSARGWKAPSIVIRPGFASRAIAGQVSKFFQMFRPQWLGNDMFAAEPFAKVNQFAAL